MLCEVVFQVGVFWTPINFEFSLGFSVAWPMESHVHGFGAF
jgi:hypothetical protein